MRGNILTPSIASIEAASRCVLAPAHRTLVHLPLLRPNVYNSPLEGSSHAGIAIRPAGAIRRLAAVLCARCLFVGRQNNSGVKPRSVRRGVVRV